MFLQWSLMIYWSLPGGPDGFSNIGNQLVNRLLPVILCSAIFFFKKLLQIRVIGIFENLSNPWNKWSIAFAKIHPYIRTYSRLFERIHEMKAKVSITFLQIFFFIQRFYDNFVSQNVFWRTDYLNTAILQILKQNAVAS